ncbi:MAG: hypothetical protein RBG13Loki_1428 [Promethearchaeota archaeon CR_4]|nr:MAG: hypothetical protein RBG13Loki_1428 [Candidatus Lokiarchaeota archaeon CR_4]
MFLWPYFLQGLTRGVDLPSGVKYLDNLEILVVKRYSEFAFVIHPLIQREYIGRDPYFQRVFEGEQSLGPFVVIVKFDLSTMYYPKISLVIFQAEDLNA